MVEKKKFAPTDISAIIADHVWNNFMAKKGFPLNIFYRRNRFYVDIKWAHAEFRHTTKLREDSRPAEDMGVPKDVVLHFSEYENKTPMDQQYTFMTSRETSASTSIEFQETYTYGAETSIEVSLPGDIVTIGAGLSGSLEVSESKGQTFEETMSWEVNTAINVKKGHRTKANLCVSERTAILDFDVETEMSLISGKLPAAIKRKSDNEIVNVQVLTNLENVFKEHENENLKVKENYDEATENVSYSLVLKSHGTCKSISWQNQHVKVESHPIKGLNFAIEETSENDASKDGQ